MTDPVNNNQPAKTSTGREITGVALASLLALAAARLSEAAGWMELPNLLPLCLVALGTATILVRLHWPAWFIYPLSLAACVTTTLAFGAGAVTGEGWWEKINVTGGRLKDWWELVSAGETAKDNLPLVLLLLAIIWLIAYLSVWLLVKPRRKWLGAVPSVAWILINVRYVPQAASFYFGVYLAALALFLVYLQLREGWQHLQRLSFLAFLLAISVPLLAASWAIPQLTLSQYLGNVKSLTESRWGYLETTFNRYFSPNPAVETNAPAPGAPLHTFGPEMVLKGSMNVPQTKVMTLASPTPGYLRGATYEVYTGTGWKQVDPAGPGVGKRLDVITEPYKMRRQITQTVTVGSTTDVVFAIGQPLSTSLNATGIFPTPMSFTIPLDGSPSSLMNLPPDVQKVGQDLNTYFAQRRPAAKSRDQARPATPGFTIRRVVRDSNEIKAVEIVREETDGPDVLALRHPSPLKPGTRYTMVSSISNATYVELREAGEAYPAWVTDRYLQLTRNLPESVRQLTYEVTHTATNPYDKALAIEIYLRQLDYNTAIKTPPNNTDVVEYFLFKAPEGYCNYFATAMVVMLRSAGIPARMAVGFNQGEYDLEQEAWVIKESNAHAWPEVFFPNYGWVEFEPTPSQPPLSHEPPGAAVDEEQPEPDSPVQTPEEESWVARETGISLLGVICAVLTFGWLAWNLSLRRFSSPSRLYEKTRRLGFLARIRRRPSDTPLEYARKLEAELPSHSEDIEAIIKAYVETTFGKKTLARTAHEQLQTSWVRLRKALILRAIYLR